MKWNKAPLILAMLLVTASAFAQRSAIHDSNESTTAIVAARCAYALSDPSCPGPTTAASDQRRTAPPTFPRRGPAPPPYPPRPRGIRMANPAPGPVFRGAIIGGMIGFALGAAAPKEASGRDRFGLGMLVGLAGAGIGAAIGANHSYYRSPRVYEPWPDEEGAALHSKDAPGNPAGTVSIADKSGTDSLAKNPYPDCCISWKVGRSTGLPP